MYLKVVRKIKKEIEKRLKIFNSWNFFLVVVPHMKT